MSDKKQDLYDSLSVALAQEFLTMRKRRRRAFWFKLFFFVILIIFIMSFMVQKGHIKNILETHTALINIKGVIGENMNVEAQPIIGKLNQAMGNIYTKGVILEINSPGGSPVHAALIYDEIIKLRAKYPKKPLHCVITDIAASAAYYIASACEKIYAYRASLVGSIGVVLSSFGFTDTLTKLGIERRLMTAGEHKGILDPFSPLKSAEKAHLQGMLDQLHQIFIADVKKARGDKLKNSAEIFSGLFWSGDKSKELGLIDGFASRDDVAKNIIGEKRIYDYTPVFDPFERFFRMAQSITNMYSQPVLR